MEKRTISIIFILLMLNLFLRQPSKRLNWFLFPFDETREYNENTVFNVKYLLFTYYLFYFAANVTSLNYKSRAIFLIHVHLFTKSQQNKKKCYFSYKNGISCILLHNITTHVITRSGNV